MPPVERIVGMEKELSAIALGTAAYTVADKAQWFSILDAYAAQGGTVLDTARMYSGGQSERIVGEWLAGSAYRDRMVLITKAGHGENILPEEHCEATIEAELAESLRVCKVDHIDMFMLHRDNERVPVERIMACLHAFIEDGRVRALGASNWTYPRTQAANAFAEQRGLTSFATVSNTLSLARPAAPFFPGLVATDDAGERWHRETGIPLIPWSAQARGFFTGRYTPDTADPNNPHDQRMLEVYATPENLEHLRRAQALAAQHGCTAMEIALAWVLHRPYPVLPIVGPRTVEELESCLRACEVTLSSDDAAWLDGTTD